ncbi:MAG: DoxX family protein [Candidatus Paceibacterota bacterium]|jgi:uncharacterized membrane protein YphA (DoxX/SURF4 family)
MKLSQSNLLHIGLGVIRIAVGAVFLYHGVIKALMMSQTVGFMGSLGISAFLTYCVAGSEIIGGLLLVMGLFERYAAGALSVVMVGAMFLVTRQGFPEYEFILFIILLGLIISGAGQYRISCRCGMCSHCKGKEGEIK